MSAHSQRTLSRWSINSGLLSAWWYCNISASYFLLARVALQDALLLPSLFTYLLVGARDKSALLVHVALQHNMALAAAIVHPHQAGGVGGPQLLEHDVQTRHGFGVKGLALPRILLSGGFAQDETVGTGENKRKHLVLRFLRCSFPACPCRTV